MYLPPALTGVERRVLAEQLVRQPVEALVPTGGVAGGLAQLVEGVQQRELRAVAVGLQLEAKGVRRPRELEHPWTVRDDHLALERLESPLCVAEAERRA